MKSKFGIIALSGTILTSTISPTLSHAEVIPTPTEENSTFEKAKNELDQIQQDITASIDEGVVESTFQTTEPIDLGDGVSLVSSEQVNYDENGNVIGKYSVEVKPSIPNKRAVINEGGYSWKFFSTKYSDTVVEHEGYVIVSRLLPSAIPFMPTRLQQAAAATLLTYIQYYPRPKLYYFTNHTYTDSDNVNNYIKTDTYTYSDKARTKLVSKKSTIVKSKK
ncbi:hypothetical protein [Bacillus sp. AFS088145]|uniref:hypothetical protein n=1 Tax=Bacillus sp. AFS088145 TaxID=2033514 RepID=UPI000BFA6654|nr:hypothetical protein [Bacillus sp. AFS088145]PFH85773.1 hypothetical protein COI44_14260 [Bacillus sp. AFS088145]